MAKNVQVDQLYFLWMAPAYDRVRPLAWPMLRVAAGLIMISHGVPKLFGSFAPILAKNVLTPLGLPGAIYWAYFLGALEIFGGVLLAAGFMTRLVALMLAAETAVIFAFVSLPKGWIYSVPGGGAEFPALLLVLYLALLFEGAGNWSIDRAVKREI